MKVIPLRQLKNSSNEIEVSENFTIKEIQRVTGKGDLVQELHRHDFYYLLVIKQGKGNHIVDFTPYKISKQALFIMRPGQVHQLTLKAGTMGYIVEFKSDFYKLNDLAGQKLRSASNVNHYPLSTSVSKRVFSIFMSTYEEYTERQEGYLEIIHANLNILFIELLRQNSMFTQKNELTFAQQQLNELYQLFEKHISKYKQVSDYADKMNLSSYQLNSITKITRGKTCSALINEYIVLEAKRYLLATPNQITQIAWHLGYEDASYFIRFFRKQTGYTPEAFRKKFK